MKKNPLKLVLNKETLRLLQEPEDLREAAGGFSAMITISGCVACICGSGASTCC
jgi:hypothetical protein